LNKSTNSLKHFKEITKIIHIPGLLYQTTYFEPTCYNFKMQNKESI